MVFPVFSITTVFAFHQASAVMLHWINYLTITVLTIALFWLLLSDSRKSTTIAFCVVVLMVFSINIQFWTFGFALSKLITGIMAMLVMAISPSIPELHGKGGTRAGKVFRAVGFGFCILLTIFTTNITTEFLSISHDQTIPSLFILFCGFLMIGISKESFHIIIGLLTVLTGFEILYGAVEQSLLVNGLLAAVFLLIAVVGSYLMTPTIEEEEE